jgi:hypothetical protein
MTLQPFAGPWPLYQFRNLFCTDGSTPWTSDQPVARPLPIHRAIQTQNKRTHRHPCLWVRFEPTNPAFEQAKTVHALERAATVIGITSKCPQVFPRNFRFIILPNRQAPGSCNIVVQCKSIKLKHCLFQSLFNHMSLRGAVQLEMLLKYIVNGVGRLWMVSR